MYCTSGLIEDIVRGPMFEWFARVVVGKVVESISVKLTSLSKTGSQETRKIRMQPFAYFTRVFEDASSLYNVRLGEFMQPKNPYYPAIDAFILCKGVSWEAPIALNHNPTFIFFQGTVARIISQWDNL